MNKIFFTSDTHFGHKNIIKYENRPFASVEHMDYQLIENWNKKVETGDTVYILGDFCFGNKDYAINILQKLNGQKFLVKGNHDSLVKEKDFTSQFTWVKDYHKLKYQEIKFILFHFPIEVWDEKHHDSIHLYGHVHSNMYTSHPMKKGQPNSYNVGVDVNDYAPIEIDEILKKLGR